MRFQDEVMHQMDYSEYVNYARLRLAARTGRIT
jgi:hypothetical protein